MNAKKWNNLKSQRDLEHRTARKAKKLGKLRHKQSLLRMERTIVPITPRPKVLFEDLDKPKQRLGIFKRLLEG